uniref:Uncharacterized protein n=1 Tax=Anguilla anguilla TaxID=7936 RepID=A0A0E9W2S1_ANGAN
MLLIYIYFCLTECGLCILS